MVIFYLTLPMCLANLLHTVTLPGHFMVTFGLWRSCQKMFLVALKYSVLVAAFFSTGQTLGFKCATCVSALTFLFATFFDVLTLLIRVFSLILIQQCKESNYPTNDQRKEAITNSIETKRTTKDIFSKTKKNIDLYKDIVTGSAPLLLMAYSFSTLMVITQTYGLVRKPKLLINHINA